MIYGASKTKHAPLWRAYRAAGVPINSTWIDQAGPGESDSSEALCARCIAEAKSAIVLVAFMAPDETPKGMLVEVGAALAFCRRVLAVGTTEEQTWRNHTLVTQVSTLDEAIKLAVEINTKFSR